MSNALSRILGAAQEIAASDNSPTQRVRHFVQWLRQNAGVDAIAVYRLRADSDRFVQETVLASEEFATELKRERVPANIKFSNQLQFETVPVFIFETDLANHRQDQNLCTVSYYDDGIPSLMLLRTTSSKYSARDHFLLGLAGNELLHLLRLRQLATRLDCLRSITEVASASSDRGHLLSELLLRLRRNLGADGASILEIVPTSEPVLLLRKTFQHGKRFEVVTFQADRGFAHHCLTNRRALIVHRTFDEGGIPFGDCVEFDLDHISLGFGRNIRLESMEAPQTYDRERSLMYFPIIYEDRVLGAIKLADFRRDGVYDIADLLTLQTVTSAVTAAMVSLIALDSLQAQANGADLGRRMADQAETLFFYREIALGIFHQVGNHVNLLDSTLMLAESLAEAGSSGIVDLPVQISDARKSVRVAKDLIHLAQERGRRLKPVNDLAKLLQDVVRPVVRYAERAAGENINVYPTLGKTEYVVFLDTELAKEVLINLVNNALWSVREFRGGRREITIAVRPAESQPNTVRIELHDSGVGIEPQLFSRLFEPFFTTRPNGTGLGLHFSRQLVRHFGGDLKLVRSLPGKGATFELFLPFLEAHE